MTRLLRIAPFLASALLALGAPAPAGPAPHYTAGGEMLFPEHYREWVYLSSGFDMSYNPSAQMEGHHSFDNVFVNPEAYRSFLETGTWPDHTLLVLEVRAGQGKGSINQKGNYQGERRAVEVHAKDTQSDGSWAFYGFEAPGTAQTTAKKIPATADCY